MSFRDVLRVALIAGGSSSEREVSLQGAKAVEKALIELGHRVSRFDPATELALLVQRAKEFDVAFIILHGKGGEDGSIQGLLDLLGLPYQGAGVLGSALAMHKGLTKKFYRMANLPTPEGETFHKRTSPGKIREFAKQLSHPLIVKPASQGSSVGLSLVEGEEDLDAALELAFSFDEEILVERYVKGREITGGVLGEEALPLVEIRPKGNPLFTYDTKYTPGLADEVCPAPIELELTRKAQAYALSAHRILRLRHYSRTDMILSGGEFYLLETNTIPGMTETSLLPLAATIAGYTFRDLVQRLLNLAIEKS